MLTHNKEFNNENLRFLRQLFFEKRLIFLEGFMFEAYISDPTMPMGWTCSPRGAIDQLIHLSNKPDEPVILFIDSGGGSLHTAITLHDIMKAIPCPIHTVALGLAASAATLVLAAGTQGKRFMFPHAKTMIHPPRLKGYVDVDDKEMEIIKAELAKSKNNYIELLAKYTNKQVREIEALIEREHWMNAEETKAFGLIDHIIRNFSDIGINLN